MQEEKENANLVKQTPSKREYPFGRKHAFYAVMGGYFFDIPHSAELEETQQSTQPSMTIRDTPTADAFLYIIQNFPDIIPDISEESIMDYARGNGLSKAILMAQVGWFCFNCLTRLVESLPLSLAEVSTVAHCFCTLLTYFVWWSKPFNIVVPAPMRGQRAREVHALLKCTPCEYQTALKIARETSLGSFNESQGTLTSLSTFEAQSTNLDRIHLAARALVQPPSSLPPCPEAAFLRQPLLDVPGSCCSPEMISDRTRAILVIATRLLYGLPHFLGWNADFHTSHERLLWRISTVIVTSSGLLTVLGAALLKYALRFMSPKHVSALEKVAAVIMVSAYIIASILLVIESIWQLFFLPPAAYKIASWANYWPHFS